MKTLLLPLIAASVALPALTSHGAALVTDGSTVGGTTVSVTLANHASGGSVTTSINGSGNLVFAPNVGAPNNDYFVNFPALGLDTSVIGYAQIDFLTTSAGAVTGGTEMFHTDDNSSIGGANNSSQSLGSPTVTVGGPFSIVVDLAAGQPINGAGQGWGPGISNNVRFDLFQVAANQGETFEITAVTFGSQLVPEPSSALLGLFGGLLLLRRRR